MCVDEAWLHTRSYRRVLTSPAPLACVQDAHHSVNTGNYGSSFAWGDTLFGTHIAHERVVRAGKRKPLPDEAVQVPASEGGGDDVSVATAPSAAGASGQDTGEKAVSERRRRGRSPLPSKIK